MNYFRRKTKVKKPRKHYVCALCGKLIIGEHLSFCEKNGKGIYYDTRHIKCDNKVDLMCYNCHNEFRCFTEHISIIKCFEEKYLK